MPERAYSHHVEHLVGDDVLEVLVPKKGSDVSGVELHDTDDGAIIVDAVFLPDVARTGLAQPLAGTVDRVDGRENQESVDCACKRGDIAAGAGARGDIDSLDIHERKPADDDRSDACRRSGEEGPVLALYRRPEKPDLEGIRRLNARCDDQTLGADLDAHLLRRVGLAESPCRRRYGAIGVDRSGAARERS